MSYAKIKEVAQMPHLLEIQNESYKWFVEEGLKEVFEDISPIHDYAGNLVLEFIDYYDSYKETCIQLYEIKKNVFLAMENLNTVVGQNVLNY